MAETTTPAAPDADAGTATADQHPGVQTPDTEQLGEAGLTALRSEREARKAAEKQLRDAQAALSKFEDANKTEAQRLTDNASKAEQRAQAAEQRLTEALTRQAVIDAALAANTIDAETVAVLAMSSGQITINDQGEVAGAKQAIAQLAKSKPHLFRTTPAGTRDATTPGSDFALNDGDALTRAVLSAVNR